MKINLRNFIVQTLCYYRVPIALRGFSFNFFYMTCSILKHCWPNMQIVWFKTVLLNNRVCTVKLPVVEFYFLCNTTRIKLPFNLSVYLICYISVKNTIFCRRQRSQNTNYNFKLNLTTRKEWHLSIDILNQLVQICLHGFCSSNDVV